MDNLTKPEELKQEENTKAMDEVADILSVDTDEETHSEESEEEIIENWKQHIRRVLKNFTPDAFIADGFGHLEFFLRALKELGFSPGKDIHVLGDCDFSPGLVMIRSDYSEFIRSAAAIIHRIIEEPGYHCGIMEISGKIKRTPFQIESV